MIKIEERPSRKVPTSTSLFLSFDYNEEILNLIKKSELAIWDKKDKVWEIPTTDLAKLVEPLRTLDDVQIFPYKETLVDTKVERQVDYKTQPFSYQLEGIEYGLNHNKWLLLDQMGLGKTLTAICLAEELKKQKGIKHCLIISGIDSLKTNWKLEIKKHSNESCIILGERVNRNGKTVYDSVPKRAEQLKNKIDEFFIITNIATFRSKEVVEAFKHSENEIDLIVIDEIHAIRNVGKKGSQQGNNALELDSSYKLGMTGTPIMKNPEDLYAPLTWIGAIPTGKTNFQRYYCLLDDKYQVFGYKNIDILTDLLHKHSLRRTVDILKSEGKELPPLTIIHEVLDMNSDQSTFYENVKLGMADEVDKVKLNYNNLYSIYARLRQATSCPSILTTESISSTKIDRAIDLIDSITSEGNKVIVYSIFKEPLRQLQQKISHLKPLLGTGEMGEEEFYSNVNEFQTNPDKKVFLGTVQKMGTGITLTAANYAIFLDADWIAEVDKQAEARIYRIGATRPVFIYYLWNNNTIDMRVKETVESKLQVANYMVDDIMPDESIMTDTLYKLIENEYRKEDI